MICKVCGKLSAHGDRCLYCGTKQGRIVNTISAGHAVQTASIEEIYSAALERNRSKTQKSEKKKNIDYAKRNKRLSVSGLVLGSLIVAIAVVAVIFFILGIETWRIVSPDTGEYIYKTFPTNFVPLICGFAGIGIIIPAIIISVVSMVRTFKNGYGTKNINISSVIITLVASVVLLPCGIYTMFNMPNFWFGDVDDISDDQYAYELLQDKEKDKLTDYVYKHYVVKLVDNPEYLSVYVQLNDYWVFPNGLLEYTQTYSSNIAFCLDEIDVIYTQSDGNETKLLFNKITFSYRGKYDLSDAAVHAYDILTDKYDESVRYIIGEPQELFVYDNETTKNNQEFIDEFYSLVGVQSNDCISAFKVRSDNSLVFEFIYLGNELRLDYEYDMYNLSASFDMGGYQSEYRYLHYVDYVKENYEEWMQDKDESSTVDFETFFKQNDYMYSQMFDDKINSEVSDGIYDYNVLVQMMQKKASGDQLYQSYVSCSWQRDGNFDFLQSLLRL